MIVESRLEIVFYIEAGRSIRCRGHKISRDVVVIIIIIFIVFILLQFLLLVSLLVLFL